MAVALGFPLTAVSSIAGGSLWLGLVSVVGVVGCVCVVSLSAPSSPKGGSVRLGVVGMVVVLGFVCVGGSCAVRRAMACVTSVVVSSFFL